MFKTNSEKVFLTLMLIMAIVLFFSISGCAMLDKLRGGVNPHADVLIEVPVVDQSSQDNVEDIKE